MEQFLQYPLVVLAEVRRWPEVVYPPAVGGPREGENGTRTRHRVLDMGHETTLHQVRVGKYLCGVEHRRRWNADSLQSRHNLFYVQAKSPLLYDRFQCILVFQAGRRSSKP